MSTLPIAVMLVEDHKTMLWGLQRLIGEAQHRHAGGRHRDQCDRGA